MESSCSKQEPWSSELFAVYGNTGTHPHPMFLPRFMPSHWRRVWHLPIEQGGRPIPGYGYAPLHFSKGSEKIYRALVPWMPGEQVAPLACRHWLHRLTPLADLTSECKPSEVCGHSWSGSVQHHLRCCLLSPNVTHFILLLYYPFPVWR